MSESIENPLKGRFLIFRKWKPTYGAEYNFYYAIAPGETWGVIIRKGDGKEVLPYEIQRVTMDSVLGPDQEDCTEEEFLEFYKTAIGQIEATMKRCLRPID